MIKKKPILTERDALVTLMSYKLILQRRTLLLLLPYVLTHMCGKLESCASLRNFLIFLFLFLFSDISPTPPPRPPQAKVGAAF